MRQLILLALFVMSCAGAPASSSSYRVGGTLVVDNQQYTDLNIYIQHAGTKGRRIGTVIGYSKMTFALTTMDLATSTIQFRAHQLGTRDEQDIISDTVPAQNGSLVTLTLGSPRGSSFVTYRQQAN